jgi:hypothetical protein
VATVLLPSLTRTGRHCRRLGDNSGGINAGGRWRRRASSRLMAFGLSQGQGLEVAY